MLNKLRRYVASCSLDRPGPTSDRAGTGEFAEVHRLLSEHAAAPVRVPPPALRSRIMASLQDAAAPEHAGPRLGWWWAVTAMACLVLALVAMPSLKPVALPTMGPGRDTFSRILIPVAPAPMFRLVAGSMDKPLMDQAQKMYDDTRRATRAVVSCVPFSRRGG